MRRVLLQQRRQMEVRLIERTCFQRLFRQSDTGIGVFLEGEDASPEWNSQLGLGDPETDEGVLCF